MAIYKLLHQHQVRLIAKLNISMSRKKVEIEIVLAFCDFFVHKEH